MLPARWPKELALCIAVLAGAHDLSAQVTYTVVANLGTVGGAAPLGGVIRGTDGALYGTTSEGGAENCGIVYRIDPAGALTRIHEFSQPDGCRPVGELALGPDGNLYGVTERGGNADPQRGAGTIYKIASDGTYTVLHRFVFPVAQDPEPWLVPFRPYAGLTLAPDGFFYGTTMSDDIFRISPEGAFTLVRQFAPPDMEPEHLTAALTLGTDGNLYSTSQIFVLIVPRAGGTVFRINLAGDAEVLHRFFVLFPFLIPPAPEGALPEGELAEGPDGEFYGANATHGPSVTGQGTIFRIQPDGTLAVLYAFSQGPNQTYPEGANPRAGLILGADGYIYGTTAAGGANGNGTIFRMSRNGGLATLRSFALDGFAPTKGRLLEATPGVFYGTAPSASGGVVYELRVAGDTLLAESRLWTTDEDHSVNGTLTATGAGPSATFSLVSNGSLGTATVDPATGAFTYTPNPNANGIDSFTFSITDGAGQSNIATVFVRIVPVDDTPVAFDLSITTTENTPVQGALSASNPDNEGLVFRVQTNPTKGTVQLTDPFAGLFTYTPNLGATGPDAFTFRVVDAGPTPGVGTVSVTIVPAVLAISLVAPLGGEKLFAGIPTTIQWTVTGAVGIDVEFSRDGGRSFAPIAGCAGLPGSSTSCTWTPTGPPTPKARIRVVAHNAAGEQVSDVTDNLRIAVASPRVKLVFPHTGVGLQTGTTQTIWWTHNLGERSFVRLELSRDGGVSWEVIEPAIQNMTAHVGAFNWLVTGPATTTAFIRVTSLAAGVSDVNNRPFAIVMPSF